MRIPSFVLARAAALAVRLLRVCCRTRLHDDPRPQLRSDAQPYVYSVLHAHQVATVIDGEQGTGAMVSRSGDGDLLIPMLRARGIIPFRGSQRQHTQDKGGRAALDGLIAHVRSGAPAYVAVDGPRGPRNRVRKGVAQLSQQTGAVVLNLVAVPSRRWIFSRSWDRMQIPKPFAVIDVHFGEPLVPREGETVEQYRRRIEAALNELEQEHDPVEATRPRSARRPGRKVTV